MTRLRLERQGGMFLLHAPHATLTLDTRRGLRAVSLTNRFTNRVLPLGGGSEFDLDLDAARERFWIGGWRGIATDKAGHAPNRESGFRAGYHRPEFDDSKWTARDQPSMFTWRQPQTWYWMRTHLFLPDRCRSEALTLVLGGFGLTDFRFMRVFVNGIVAGTRRPKGRWFLPGEFDLGPHAPIHPHVRFGQDNVIVLQLAGPINRTARLDELDPHETHSLPAPVACASPFLQFVVAGRPSVSPTFRVRSVEAAQSSVRIHLESRKPAIAAALTYRLRDEGQVFERAVQLQNRSANPVRLLNVRLGTYRTTSRVSEGEMGFPVYADDEVFFSLDHPAGWATGQDGMIQLRQYPGALLQPRQTFHCMNSVIGVAEREGANRLFLTHLRRRMRRTVRGHDKPLAIFEFFGAWNRATKKQFLNEDLTEAFSLRMIERLRRFRRETGSQFDRMCLEFWCDRAGDLMRFKPKGFPHGFEPVRESLRQIGVKPGLWIDMSTSQWNIGENPVVAPCFAEGDGYAPVTTSGRLLCRAAEPYRSMFTHAFVRHVCENGVRLLKFDGARAMCHNQRHDHLPGLYSIESSYNAIIETLHALDAACPDVFLILYWGHRSPWWLLHGDTIFEPGLHMEAASPSPEPTLYARDGANLNLDMAQWYCRDVPWFGKDSLGVWLSDWPWNSMIGKERWQEGFVLDLCRGSLLAQLWSDADLLSRRERRQLATFLALLRARPECFRNARFILGNPWKGEPYGYCCSDGRRAFVAIHNCSWSDARIRLELNAKWGLRGDCRWDIYRWHPEPARLEGDSRSIALRPFEVVLLEVVPAGESPSLNRAFPTQPFPTEFAEPSRELKSSVSAIRVTKDRRELSVHLRVPATASGGTLVVTADRNRNGCAFQTRYPGREWRLTARLRSKKAVVVPVLGAHTYPSSWQAWRIRINPSPRARRFDGTIVAETPPDVKITCCCYFVPS